MVIPNRDNDTSDGRDINEVHVQLKKYDEILNGNVKNGQIPPKWDSEAGKRIVKIIGRFLS